MDTKMCVHPCAPPAWFDSWLIYMHVTELHVYVNIHMVFKAILCTKHNTDMYPTYDCMVVLRMHVYCTWRSNNFKT